MPPVLLHARQPARRRCNMRLPRLAIPTQRPNHPSPTHPQLPYLDDSALESWGVTQKVTAAFLGKKKSAREEHSISLALGGARSSTPSLHHPWWIAATPSTRQLRPVCDVDQGGSPSRWRRRKLYRCPRCTERYTHDRARHHDLYHCPARPRMRHPMPLARYVRSYSDIAKAVIQDRLSRGLCG